MKTLILSTCAAGGLMLAGCATTADQQDTINSAMTGAAAGAAIGAVSGDVDPAEGAAVGAAAGAAGNIGSEEIEERQRQSEYRDYDGDGVADRYDDDPNDPDDY